MKFRSGRRGFAGKRADLLLGRALGTECSQLKLIYNSAVISPAVISPRLSTLMYSSPPSFPDARCQMPKAAEKSNIP